MRLYPMPSRVRPRAAALMITLAAMAASAGHAEVYKWVDDKGQTHYGERQPGGSASASQVKIKPSPAVAPPPPPKADNWFQPTKPTDKPKPAVEQAKKSISGGREHGTDESRCALARDVLNGSLQHANGNPIDKYDIDTAKNDVKMFCKSR